MRLLLPAVLLLLAAAACGAEEATRPATPATLPAAALPELDSRARTLDVASVADDAFEPDALAALLSEGGYVTGREREFSGKATVFDHVVARTLVFESRQGADAYLGWVRGHGDEVLGRAAPAKVAPPGEDGVAFILERCGTCKKELPTFLAAWRREATVMTLLAAGDGADAASFSALAHELDEAAA
ncbi:MAG: hypothetical protein ACRDNR_16375 [Gaiellaceae bacterium]